MQVQRTGSNSAFKSGVYFSKSANIYLKNTGTQINNAVTKVSENGYEYLENTSITKPLRDKFLKNKFVKKLAERFDTFVWFEQVPANKKIGSGYIAMARILWADPSKNALQSKGVRGISRSTSQRAVDNMFKDLK